MTYQEARNLFRKNLYSYQSEAGLSEYALSDAIEKSPSYIQAVSSGRIMPSFNTFIDLCSALHKQPGDFFIDNNLIEGIPESKKDPTE